MEKRKAPPLNAAAHQEMQVKSRTDTLAMMQGHRDAEELKLV